MNVYALQTARDGSKSVEKKNLLGSYGIPLYRWNLESARNTPEISKSFITTDIPYIIENETDVIIRPKHLCGDSSSHYDTIIHGLHAIESAENKTIDILVILLGNNKGAHSHALSAGIRYLMEYPEADSCMSVGMYNMFNPYRAYKFNDNYITTIIPQENFPNTDNANEKNAFGNTFYFNGSFWIVRRSVLMANNGLKPFTWLGNNIFPIIQSGEIMEVDAPWQTKLIRE